MTTSRTAATVGLCVHLVAGLMFVAVLRVLLTWVSAPVWWHYLVLGVAPMGFTFPLLRRAHRGLAMSVTSAYVLTLVFGFGAPWNSHDRFLVDLDRVAIGMAREEVTAIMSGHATGSGWPVLAAGREGEQIGIEGAVIYRHSDDGRWNADWGIVHYESERVACVEFSPD